MKTIKFLFLFAIVLTSCNDDDNSTSLEPVIITDVYVGGTLNKNAVYWKNDELVQLTYSTINTVEEVIDMVVTSNEDVHIIGNTATGGAYWLNNNRTDLSFDPIKIIVNTQGDVYILGELEYLRNNISFTTGMINFDMAVVEDDIHIVGSKNSRPYYYLNGNSSELSNNGQSSYAECLKVYQQDVYIAGGMRAEAGSNNYLVSRWLNGNRTDLTVVDEDCYAYDIKIINDAVHIIGSYFNTVNNEFGGAHWVNNDLQPIINGSYEFYGLDSLNNNVYISGNYNVYNDDIYRYGYWINNNWINLYQETSATQLSMWSNTIFIHKYEQ